MSLFKVFVLFLRLGALTFGGGIVMIGLLERELRGTEKLSSEETMEMIIFATALPGPIAANLAWLAGEKLAGKTGAFTAVLGTVIPPFLTILFLSKFFLLHMNDPLIAAFFLGAACAVAVIIGGVVFDMTKISFSGEGSRHSGQKPDPSHRFISAFFPIVRQRKKLLCTCP
jgi:chromate transporter